MRMFEKFPGKLRNQLWILGLGLSLVAIWLTFASLSFDPIEATPTKNQTPKQSPQPVKQEIRGETKAIAPERKNASLTRSLPRPESASSNSNASTRISDLIAKQDLSHDETARQLAVIALDPNNPEAERLEAMEHGKNLGFSHLLPLSADPNLPLPLTESFLHGLHGHDQIKEQVSGALGLLNHVDHDIREQAQTLLGFLLSKEEDNESPDKLRTAAEAFLKQPDEEPEADADTR
jgi:hypothetical protein